jgi:hypothetical protein
MGSDHRSTEDDRPASMLRFTGEPLPQHHSLRVTHRAVNQDAELVEAFVSAIQVLGRAAGMARASRNDEGTEGRRAAGALLAYSILAVGEARAFLLLLGDGLDKHARVHMRSILEYEFRVRTLLNDDSIAPGLHAVFRL